MKNRKLILLSVLVLGIWGTIAARIVMSLDDEENIAQPRFRKIASDTVRAIGYDLALTYEDPFLNTVRKKAATKSAVTVKSQSKSSIIRTTIAPATVIPWDLINYSGLIYNSTRKSKTAAVNIGNTEYFLKEGEESEHFKVLEIFPDSIKVTYINSNQIKYIKKN